jgi:hypothetical protein
MIVQNINVTIFLLNKYIYHVILSIISYMKNIDKLVKEMTSNIQQTCAERIELATQNAKSIHKPQAAIDNYSISSIMKRKHGL